MNTLHYRQRFVGRASLPASRVSRSIARKERLAGRLLPELRLTDGFAPSNTAGDGRQGDNADEQP
jgi:hypothetical protein